MNDVKNKKVIARLQYKAKHGKPKAKKKSAPLTHIRTKPSKAERIKARKERQLKNRLARGSKVMNMLKDLRDDIKAQINGREI